MGVDFLVTGHSPWFNMESPIWEKGRVTVAVVKTGGYEFEGLMLDDGSLFVDIYQLTVLGLARPNRSLKQLESSLGISLPSAKKVKTDTGTKAVTCISLLDLERVLIALLQRGVEAAVDTSGRLIGLALTQLFSDALGRTFEVEDREAYLQSRKKLVSTPRTFNDAIQLYLSTKGMSDRYNGWVYASVSDALKEAMGDSHSVEDLKTIAAIENLAMRLVDFKGYEPLAAIKTAIELLV